MPTFRGLPRFGLVVLRLVAAGSDNSPGSSATMTSSVTLSPMLPSEAEGPLGLVVGLDFLGTTGGMSVVFDRPRLEIRTGGTGGTSIWSVLPPVESRDGVLPTAPGTVANETRTALRSSGSARRLDERS